MLEAVPRRAAREPLFGRTRLQKQCALKEALLESNRFPPGISASLHCGSILSVFSDGYDIYYASPEMIANLAGGRFKV